MTSTDRFRRTQKRHYSLQGKPLPRLLQRGLLVLPLIGLPLAAQGPGGHGGMPGGPGGGMPGRMGPGAPGGPGMGHNPAPGAPGGGGNVSTGAPRIQGPGGRWWDDNKYAHNVGLTGDQQRRMDSVFQENRNALVSGLDNLHKTQARLDALSAADHPNESAVLAEIQNVAQARADLAKANAHMQLQLRNEMTNEQINKLDKLK